MNKLLIFFFLIIVSGCSKKEDKVLPINVTEDPIIVLDLSSVEQISDTPYDNLKASIVYQNKLYVVDDLKKTHMFDFNTKSWTLISENSSLAIGLQVPTSIGFIRNGKWYVCYYQGIYEFDFELKEWLLVTSFDSAYNFYAIQGFNVDESIFFIDASNGKENIFKYDFSLNELTVHGTFENLGYYGEMSNSAFKIGENFYFSQLTTTGFRISKFSKDFTEIENLNNYRPNNLLTGGIAVPYRDYIIFGLGGFHAYDSNGDYSNHQYSSILHVYDTKLNEFYEMPTSFNDEFSFGGVASTNDNIYLLNGFKTEENILRYRKSIEKLNFDFVQQN